MLPKPQLRYRVFSLLEVFLDYFYQCLFWEGRVERRIDTERDLFRIICLQACASRKRLVEKLVLQERKYNDH